MHLEMPTFVGTCSWSLVRGQLASILDPTPTLHAPWILLRIVVAKLDMVSVRPPCTCIAGKHCDYWDRHHG